VVPTVIHIHFESKMPRTTTSKSTSGDEGMSLGQIMEISSNQEAFNNSEPEQKSKVNNNHLSSYSDSYDSTSNSVEQVENERSSNNTMSGTILFQKACDLNNQIRHEIVENFLSKAKNNDQDEKDVKLQTVIFLLHSLGFSEQDIIVKDLEVVLDGENNESDNSMRFLKSLINSHQNTKGVKKSKLLIPIHGKKADKMQCFPANFRRFWMSFIKVTAYFESFTNEQGGAGDEILPTVLLWLSLICQLPERRYRLTGTIAALQITTAFTKVYKMNEDEIIRLDLQIQANSRKKNKDGRKRLESLKSRKKLLNQRKTNMRDNIDNLFSAFFMHRQRDIAEEIRIETSKAFADWIKYCPEIFMANETGLRIRYIGAHLCDEHYKVRIQTLKTLNVAYKNDGHFSVPTIFTTQWMERMVDLTRDRHEKVTVEACKLLKTISFLDLTRRASNDGENTERRNFTKLSKLLFAEESTIRRSVAEVVITILNREPIFSADDDANNNSRRIRGASVTKSTTVNTDGTTITTSNVALDSDTDDDNEVQEIAVEEQNKIQLSNLLNLFKEFKLGPAYAPHLVDAFEPYDEVSALHDFKYLANGLASPDLNDWTAQEVDVVVAIFADIVRRAAGAKDLHDEPKGFLNTDDGHFMLKRLPDLILRFQGDVKRATQLAKLVRYIDLNTLNSRDSSHFKSLFRRLHVIFLQANLFNPATGMIVDVNAPSAGRRSPPLRGNPPSPDFSPSSRRKRGLATVGTGDDQEANNNKYIANRMIEHLLSEDLDSEKNVLKLLSESIGHLVQPSHLEREANTSLRKLCQELIDQIKENFESCNSFSNQYDDDNTDDEINKKNILSFRCNLQRLAALYEDTNLIDHIGQDIFDQINIALNRFANKSVPSDLTEIHIVNASLSLLYSRIKFKISDCFFRCLKTWTLNDGTAAAEMEKKSLTSKKNKSKDIENKNDGQNESLNGSANENKSNVNEEITLDIDNEIEPIVSMRDSILSYLIILMKNKVDPKTTSDSQYDCMLHCLKISCDIAVQCKDSYRTNNTSLRQLGWDPTLEFKTVLSECFVKIYNYRTSEEYLSHEKADDGLEQHHRDEIHQYNIVEQVISPYMKYVLRERPNNCDSFGCARIILTTRKQTRGYIYELVKHMISEIKKMPNGFKTYFTIQKQTLIPMFDNAIAEPKSKQRKILLAELNAFAKKLSDKLRFSLNGQYERNVLIQFLADGLMFALGDRDDSCYLTALQPYLSLLQNTDADKLVNLINQTCQDKDLRDPWINDNDYAKKHPYYSSFCEYLRKKTEIEINVQQEYKGHTTTPESPISIKDAAIDDDNSGDAMGVDENNYDYDGKNKTGRAQPVSAPNNSSNAKKRKYSRGNAVTGLSEDEVLSDLSSSGISSSDEGDLSDNSEDDFEEALPMKDLNNESTKDGNVSDNYSTHSSSNGDVSDASRSSADNRGQVIRGLRRRSKARARRSAPRHQQMEASIDEIEEESDLSSHGSDNSENHFDMSLQSSKRQRID
jgi:hypothetical protein